MALSGKVALLTSLGFIFGMSWLVSLVTLPMVELPTPLIVRGPEAPGRGSAVYAAAVESRLDRRGSPAVVAGCFECASVLEVEAQRDEPEGATLVVAEALPPVRGSAEAALPPLYVPEAPVVALVEEPAALVGAANSVMTVTSIPEAIIASAPSSGASLLAALLPEPEADEFADPEQATPTMKRYKVKRGDTLVRIIRREWNRDDEASLRVLLAANPQVVKRRNRIYPGELLNIPDPDSAPRAPAVAHAGTAASNEKDGIRWYTIRKRDSLASIARRELKDTERWREIATLNRLRNVHKILPGMRIKLPPIRTDT